jgi:hypothetical protein
MPPALHQNPLAPAPTAAANAAASGSGSNVPLIQRFVAAAPAAGAGTGAAGGAGGRLRGQLQQGWEKGLDELGQWGERLKANPREAAKAAGVAVAALVGGAVIRHPNIRRQVRRLCLCLCVCACDCVRHSCCC